MVDCVLADVLEWAMTYEGPLFHALFCDPPYHLTTVDRFGKPGSAEAKDKDGAFRRASRGFMDKEWDGGDIAFRKETWEILKELLLPGAFGMAFASARGWHRMAVAIEDAGFVFHPSIFLFGWSYGSGMPKATRIDTAVDRKAGKLDERKVIGRYELPDGREWNLQQVDKDSKASHGILPFTSGNTKTLDITAPATPLAEAWVGHRYGLQAMKPALEPIVLFQKPYEGKPLDNITEMGAGALCIDLARLEVDLENDDPRLGGQGSFKTNKAAQFVYQGGYAGKRIQSSKLGRWPANLILGDAEAARTIDEQSGDECGGSASVQGDEPSHPTGDHGIYHRMDRIPSKFYGDSGGASRFFFQVDARLDEIDPILYCAKASRSERDAGLDGHNIHPAVKPLSLTLYLASLLLPPAAYAPRRIIVPFGGTASEAIGALLAGWEDIVMVEKDPEYVEIAQARVKFWQGWKESTGLTDPREILKRTDKRKKRKKPAVAEAVQQESFL